MPKLWSQTIEAHRREVQATVLDVTAALVAEHGLRSVTMSRIAEKSGIGRATLYKYFPDVEAIMVAWHERQITGHLDHLAEVRDRTAGAFQRLQSVLERYALIIHDSRRHRDSTVAALLHRDDRLRRAEEVLRTMIRELLDDAAHEGGIRTDVGPDELTTYCLHALSAATALPSKAAVRRLVAVTLAGLRPGR